MIVQHNMSAENTNRQLGMNVKANVSSMEKLSSGYRINRAADDAAGLAISEKMRAQIRGLDKASLNCGDGMSLIQVADGALGEVHSMLDRLKELSVQAANDTLVDEDREAIQDEVAVLLNEIDRIGDETEFNTIKVFQGETVGVPEDFANVSLGSEFLEAVNNTTLRCLPFSASYTDEDGVQQEWGFFPGFTTQSRDLAHIYMPFKIQTESGSAEYEGDLCMHWAGRTYDVNENMVSCRGIDNSSQNNSVFAVTRTIQLVQSENADYKYYEISFTIENLLDEDFSLDLMFGGETDFYKSSFSHYAVRNEAYYVDGNRVNLDSRLDGAAGISIQNITEELPFAQRIEWDSENQPDKIAVESHFYGGSITGLAYYDDIHDIFQEMDDLSRFGNDTEYTGDGDPEEGFLILTWEGRTVPAGGTTTITWRHGIVPLETATSEGTEEYSCRNFWIQSGANAFGGQYLELREMNTTVLGIHDIDMLTDDSATEANDKIETAIQAISNHRAALGAQYNRLEHAQAVDDNSEENTQASESKIRDTDMAKEMVVHAAEEILIQAGQAMLAQTNQITEGILQLLQ